MSSPAIGVRSNFIPPYARINPSHPLAADIVFCYIPIFLKDLASNIQPASTDVLSTFSTYSVSNYGRSQTQSFQSSTPNITFTSGPFSVGVACFRPSSGTNPLGFSRGTLSSNTGWALRYVSASNGWSFDVGRGDANTGLVSATDPGAGNRVVVGTSNGIDSRKIYVDGVLGNSSSINVNPLAANARVSLGGSSLYQGTGTNCQVSIACAWDRELSVGEVGLFYADPFCMLSY